MSEAAISCPKCGSTELRRSRTVSFEENFRTIAGNCPFRCLVCGERFWASLWLFSMWRWAKCPRCLNLNLTEWPKRRYHVPFWQNVFMTLGAKRHRCSACRVNFVSFRQRMPDIDAIEEDELEKPVKGNAAEPKTAGEMTAEPKSPKP